MLLPITIILLCLRGSQYLKPRILLICNPVSVSLRVMSGAMLFMDT